MKKDKQEKSGWDSPVRTLQPINLTDYDVFFYFRHKPIASLKVNHSDNTELQRHVNYSRKPSSDRAVVATKTAKWDHQILDFLSLLLFYFVMDLSVCPTHSLFCLLHDRPSKTGTLNSTVMWPTSFTWWHQHWKSVGQTSETLLSEIS